MKIILDGQTLTDRASVHVFFAEELQFPAYYGRNLDALYDLLSGWCEPLDICVIYPDVLLEKLGNYGKALLKTLQEVSEENQNLTFVISFEKIENNT